MVPESGPLVDDLAHAGVEVMIRPLAVLRRGLLTLRGLAGLAGALAGDVRDLRGVIRQRDVALVHSNTSVVLGGAAAARAAGVPHVWHVREIYDRFARVWPAYRRLLLSARALPCVSQATAAQFGAAGAGRVRIVGDGLAVDPFRAARGESRRALGLPEDAPVIAVLGRISDWKGQDVLVRALAAPQLRERGVLGLLAGEAWPGAEDRRDSVLSLADALGVRDRLVLAGFRPDVENVYGAADVIAVPSTSPDPLPNAALEAAAAGCAVVAARHGGLTEILHDGETGRLVTPRDPAALAAAAAELIDAPDERERLGTAAAADVRARFAPGRLLSELQDLYDEVLVE